MGWGTSNVRRYHSQDAENVRKRRKQDWLRDGRYYKDPHPHNCNKKHPFDCGNPRCGICSGHKRFGHEPTKQEIRSDDGMREQM